MRTLAPVLFALISWSAQAAQLYEADDESLATCERILTSHIAAWKKQAVHNLHQISPYPVHPVTIAGRAETLIAQALNIRAEDVGKLPGKSLRVSLSGERNDRLQLEIQDWPRFQRALISLREPEVIKDFSVAASTIASDITGSSVQANSRLFYPIRELPHETTLGLIVPMQPMTYYTNDLPPHFEFQIGLLKPCFDDGSEDFAQQIYTGENGESLCVDSLLVLSTWNEDLVLSQTAN